MPYQVTAFISLEPKHEGLVNNRIRSDKTGQLMTFWARELWFDPTCVQVLCWAEMNRGDKSNLKYQKIYFCRNTKNILRQFWWNIWLKPRDFLHRHLIFKPCCMNSLHAPNQRAGENLHPVLLNALWHVCPPNRRLISLTVWNPDINASHPSEAPSGSRQSHTLLFKLLFKFLVTRLYILIHSDMWPQKLLFCPWRGASWGSTPSVQTRILLRSSTFYVPSCSCLFAWAYPGPCCKAACCSSPPIFSSSSRRIPRCSKAAPPASPGSASQRTTRNSHSHMEAWLKLRNPATLHEVYVLMMMNFY